VAGVGKKTGVLVISSLAPKYLLSTVKELSAVKVLVLIQNMAESFILIPIKILGSIPV